MSGTTVALLLLGLVDVAALCIGISIRRRVTKIVRDVGGRIEAEVKSGIAEALGHLLTVARAIITPERAELLAQAEHVLEELRQ